MNCGGIVCISHQDYILFGRFQSDDLHLSESFYFGSTKLVSQWSIDACGA